MSASRLLLLVILLGGLNSCMWGVPNKTPTNASLKDTLVYTYQTINNRNADCGNKPDSGCTVVKIKYPVFNNARLLNDTVTKELTGLFSQNKLDTTLQLLSNNFLKAYTDLSKKNAKNAIKFNLDAHATVLRQDSSLITLETGGYIFTGGAHGRSPIYYINWNTKTNKNISLGDIFIDGYKDKLTKIGETIFRKDEKLSDTASLKRDYFFKDAKFALTTNYYITPLGIKFLYNQYEIKPYYAGTTTLFIPYAQIKSLLKPNTVVSQYIK